MLPRLVVDRRRRGDRPCRLSDFARGTYAAGGSDSSCYALMADAFASGRLQPSSALAAARALA